MKTQRKPWWNLLWGLALLACSALACGSAMPAGSPSEGANPTPIEAAIPYPTQASAPGDDTPVAPTQPALATQPAPSPQPVILESRLLTVEWPPSIRTGDTDYIRLTLELDEHGRLTPTVQQEGNRLQSEPVQIPNVYDTHNVLVEARLDLAGVDVAPSGEVAEPMRPGQKVSFVWNVRVADVGTYRGNIWVHLHFVPLPGASGATESREVLSNQAITIQGVNLLGLGGTPARVVGGAGTLLGSVISLDSLVSWIVKWIKGRKRKE